VRACIQPVTRSPASVAPAVPSRREAAHYVVTAIGLFVFGMDGLHQRQHLTPSEITPPGADSSQGRGAKFVAEVFVDRRSGQPVGFEVNRPLTLAASCPACLAGETPVTAWLNVESGKRHADCRVLLPTR